MEITLRINNQPQKFTQNFVSGRMFRRTLELEKAWRERDKEDPIAELDIMADYVSEVFNRQFTPDEYLDGVESHLAVSEFMRVKIQVQTGRYEAFGIDMSKLPGEGAEGEEEGELDPNA